jgi:hypothetical protein
MKNIQKSVTSVHLDIYKTLLNQLADLRSINESEHVYNSYIVFCSLCVGMCNESVCVSFIIADTAIECDLSCGCGLLPCVGWDSWDIWQDGCNISVFLYTYCLINTFKPTKFLSIWLLSMVISSWIVSSLKSICKDMKEEQRLKWNLKKKIFLKTSKLTNWQLSDHLVVDDGHK